MVRIIFEHEMYAQNADGVDMKGKADVLIHHEFASDNRLENTAKFDKPNRQSI